MRTIADDAKVGESAMQLLRQLCKAQTHDNDQERPDWCYEGRGLARFEELRSAGFIRVPSRDEFIVTRAGLAAWRKDVQQWTERCRAANAPLTLIGIARSRYQSRYARLLLWGWLPTLAHEQCMRLHQADRHASTVAVMTTHDEFRRRLPTHDEFPHRAPTRLSTSHAISHAP